MKQKNQGVTIVLSCQDRKRFATFIQILIVIGQRAQKRQAKPKKAKTNKVPKSKSDGCPCCPITVKPARKERPTRFALFRRVAYQVIARILDPYLG
jgi:hypothetical protein